MKKAGMGHREGCSVSALFCIEEVIELLKVGTYILK